MPLKRHLKAAHNTENQRVARYWKDNFPALRVPISGGGRWKGDIFVVMPDMLRYELVRRKKTDEITFRKSEIQDVIDLANRIHILTNLPYQILLVAVFSKLETRNKTVVQVHDSFQRVSDVSIKIPVSSFRSDTKEGS